MAVAVVITLAFAGQAAAGPNPLCRGRTATIVGSFEDDEIKGTASADVIWADEGDDVIHGGRGADTICAGDDDDEVSGGLGNDIIRGEGGEDTLGGGHGDDKVFGDSTRDDLFGGSGNDLLVGGNRNGRGWDWFFGGRGNDVFKGDDDAFAMYWYAHRGVVVDFKKGIARGEGRDVLKGGISRVMGSPHPDRLLGHRGTDWISGGSWASPDTNDGADVLNGRGGSDSLEGLDGNDLVIGGKGDDLFGAHSSRHGDPGHDVIRGGPGSDLTEYSEWCPSGDCEDPSEQGVYVNLETGEMESAVGSEELHSIEDVYGSDASDELIGNEGANFLTADPYYNENGGLDVIRGGAGPDTIWAEQYREGAFQGDQPDRFYGEEGNDVITGDGGSDVVEGGQGDDTIDGGAHDDEVDGGPGDDVVKGSTGLDQLEGGGGNDRLLGGFHSDELDGGPGNDFLDGKADIDLYDGGEGTDECKTEPGEVPVNCENFAAARSRPTSIELIGASAGAAQLRGVRPGWRSGDRRHRGPSGR